MASEDAHPPRSPQVSGQMHPDLALALPGAQRRRPPPWRAGPAPPVPGNLLVQQDSCLGLRASPGLSCGGGRAALDFDKEASIGLPQARHPCRTLQTPADGSAAVRAPLSPGAGGAAISGGWLARPGAAPAFI